jgi:hypothetical protein
MVTPANRSAAYAAMSAAKPVAPIPIEGMASSQMFRSCWAIISLTWLRSNWPRVSRCSTVLSHEVLPIHHRLFFFEAFPSGVLRNATPIFSKLSWPFLWVAVLDLKMNRGFFEFAFTNRFHAESFRFGFFFFGGP